MSVAGRPGALSSNAGTYNFNSDAANPLDTNLGWANALLGHLNAYTENNNNTALDAGVQPAGVLRPGQLAGDTGTFTLDLGVRFSHIGVVYDRGRDIGWFDPAAWDPAKAVKLWQPNLRQWRVPLHRRQSRRPQPADGRAAAQSLDWGGGRRIGRHQQRYRVRQGNS